MTNHSDVRCYAVALLIAVASASCAKAQSAGADSSAASVDPLIEAAKKKVVAKLVHPESARFQGVYVSAATMSPGVGPSACGEVSMTNREGKYLEFTRFYVLDDADPVFVDHLDAGSGGLFSMMLPAVCKPQTK